MPTSSPGTSSTPLTPKQTLEKLTGLITDVSDEPPDTPEPQTAEQSPAPETPPPETSDSPEPTPEEEAEYELTVDGAPTTVTLAELKASYSYKAHNTQRAQELAEKEKRLEPELRRRLEAELDSDRAQYRDGIKQIIAYQQQVLGEPDWAKKRQELEPEEFLKQKADWEASKANLERLRAHEQDEAQKAQAAFAKQHLEYLRGEEGKLQAAVPEWTDVAKGKAEIAKLAEFVRTKYGIPEPQVQSAFQSAAAILLARDAYRYAELHREPNTKPKTSGIKTAKPGTPERPRPNERQIKLVEKAAKSGRGRDAASAIEALLPD